MQFESRDAWKSGGLDEPEGPQIEKSSPARQRLPDLTREEDLRGPEQEEAAALAPSRRRGWRIIRS